MTDKPLAVGALDESASDTSRPIGRAESLPGKEFDPWEVFKASEQEKEDIKSGKKKKKGALPEIPKEKGHKPIITKSDKDDSEKPPVPGDVNWNTHA